jgi:hypothetical protein
MIHVICPKCGNLHHADEAHDGRMLRCFRCGEPVQIKLIQQRGPVASSRAAQGQVMRPHRGPSKWPYSRHWNALANRFRVALIAVTVSLVIFAVWKALPTPKAQLHRSLLTGSRLRADRNNEGRGILTVDNSSGTDAVLKISESTGQTVRCVYIRQHSKVDLEDLSIGSYQARFALGEDWDAQAQAFTRPDGYYEFGKTLVFEETQLSDGIQFSHNEITLNTTLDGNVPRLDISKATFEAR